MTNRPHSNSKRLSREILAILAVTFAISFILLLLLRICSTVVVDSILAIRDIALSDEQLLGIDGWIFNLSLLISVGFFVILFLFLLGERLSYIRDIIKGIDDLRSGELKQPVPVEGNNELTHLAEAVNYLASAQQKVKEEELALTAEKEQLIRTLSHDIRTPLTSIMAYSEFLSAHEALSAKEIHEYSSLIQKKAMQIKELTDILLDGGKRNPERFEDARLLLMQLSEEFADALEDHFEISLDLIECKSFSGCFDVRELLRIFDNLISNIQKYADSKYPVELSVRCDGQYVILRQKNARRNDSEQKESYQMGLNSIRRIAHNYNGRVEINQSESTFEITITLSGF